MTKQTNIYKNIKIIHHYITKRSIDNTNHCSSNINKR